MTDSPWRKCVKAYVRGTGGFYTFLPEQRAELSLAWSLGKPFFSGETIDGDAITIKLGEVEAVLLCTPESQEAAVVRSSRESKAADKEAF